MNDIAFFGHMISATTVKLDLPTQIFTNRLVLERLRYEEAEEIFYAYASKPEATRYMSWPTHQAIADTRAFLKYASESWDRGTDYSYSVRLQHSARLVGSFGIINDNGRVQFGYIFSPTQWGKGYATEVCKTMMEILQAIPQIRSVRSFIDIDNKASGRVLIKSGLIADGQFQKWFRFVNQNHMEKDCIHFILPLQRESLG